MQSCKILLVAVLTILSVSVFAQDTPNNKLKARKVQPAKIKYGCSMHPDIISNQPGKCPKCGMQLTKVKNEPLKMEAVKIYACPMHPEVTSNKPGKCPKCQMDLVMNKEDSTHHQH